MRPSPPPCRPLLSVAPACSVRPLIFLPPVPARTVAPFSTFTKIKLTRDLPSIYMYARSFLLIRPPLVFFPSLLLFAPRFLFLFIPLLRIAAPLGGSLLRDEHVGLGRPKGILELPIANVPLRKFRVMGRRIRFLAQFHRRRWAFFEITLHCWITSRLIASEQLRLMQFDVAESWLINRLLFSISSLFVYLCIQHFPQLSCNVLRDSREISTLFLPIFH